MTGCTYTQQCLVVPTHTNVWLYLIRPTSGCTYYRITQLEFTSQQRHQREGHGNVNGEFHILYYVLDFGMINFQVWIFWDSFKEEPKLLSLVPAIENLYSEWQTLSTLQTEADRQTDRQTHKQGHGEVNTRTITNSLRENTEALFQVTRAEYGLCNDFKTRMNRGQLWTQ